MGDGGELERTRAGWRVKRYDHVAKNKLRQNFAKVAKILLLSQKYSRTNPAKLLKTFSTSFCVCLDSWKQRNLVIRANIPKSCRKPVVCDKIGLYCSEFMLGMRTCLPCHIPDRWSRNANRIWADLAFGFVYKRSGNEINTDSDLKVHVLHYANELLVRVRLSFQKLLQNRSTYRNNTKRMFGKRIMTRTRCR